MSTFPKRLVDELDDGGARRLLESARADAPPAKLVAAAIATASRTSHAATPARPSARSGPSLRRAKLAAVAGSLVLAGVLAWSVANDARSGARPAPGGGSPTSTTSPIETSGSDHPTQETPAATQPPVPPAELAARSVLDLPDAPLATAPSSATPARGAPADLLREANRRRGEGRWAEAAATYQRVLDRGPQSPEAYPAQVALGNLELQRDRPLSALAHYESALRAHPSGVLSEEARWGKARALRAAGRVSEERAALEEFQSLHPDSPLAAAGARRLREIGQ